MHKVIWLLFKHHLSPNVLFKPPSFGPVLCHSRVDYSFESNYQVAGHTVGIHCALAALIWHIVWPCPAAATERDTLRQPDKHWFILMTCLGFVSRHFSPLSLSMATDCFYCKNVTLVPYHILTLTYTHTQPHRLTCYHNGSHKRTNMGVHK